MNEQDAITQIVRAMRRLAYLNDIRRKGVANEKHSYHAYVSAMREMRAIVNNLRKLLDQFHASRNEDGKEWDK